jgi:hypothetical protein
LYGACKSGHAEIVKYLICCFTNALWVYDAPWSYALQGACEGGQIQCAMLILDRDAIGADRGFITACKFGYTRLAQSILRHKTTQIEYVVYSAYSAMTDIMKTFGDENKPMPQSYNETLAYLKSKI